MPENQLKEIADNADMIIRNYAFTRKDNVISILNLQKFIKSHYLEMYQLWTEDSKMGFYNN